MEKLSNQVLNMNKASLEELSKSQLIKLLLNQQKPKKVTKQKSIDLDSAMKDVIARNKKINGKSDMVDLQYTKTVKSDREIYKYPMIEPSLG